MATVFESDDLKDRQVIATEKQLFGDSTSVNETANKDGDGRVEVVETKA